jgi:hypothetical protein
MLVLLGALAAEQMASRWRADPRDQVVRIE